MLTLALSFGGWEIVLILGVVLILYGAKHLPAFTRGLGDGFRKFRDAFRDALDNEAHDAGRSIGGIHGKPAAEALTPDNHVVEFYNPDLLPREQASHRWRRFIRRLVSSLRRLLRI